MSDVKWINESDGYGIMFASEIGTVVELLDGKWECFSFVSGIFDREYKSKRSAINAVERESLKAVQKYAKALGYKLVKEHES